jgi:DsbC/DsbD-like thiol-disulfide interchange protein
MNKIIALLFGFVSFYMMAQNNVEEKVVWTYTYNEQTKQVEITATIEEGWHLYSQFMSADLGPIPTSFNFSANKNIRLIGSVSEPKPEQEYNDIFEGTLDFFKDKVVFTQKVELVNDRPTTLTGTVSFMVCNETMCLPPTEIPFVIIIGSSNTTEVK